MSRALSLLFGVLLLMNSANAAVTVVATPLDEGSIAGMSPLRAHPLVQAKTSLFDSSEQAGLRGLGETALAESVKLRLARDEDRKTLELWVKSQGFRIQIEKNEKVELNEAWKPEPLERYQWAVLNSGKPQTIDFDELTTIQVPGKVGEDIGLQGLPPESTDPSRKIIVAVIDTGMDVNHPDLRSQVLFKKEECEALEKYKACLKTEDQKACDQKWASFDSDKNGYPMDCNGWNVTGAKNAATGIVGDSDVRDEIGHGTFVAGILGAAFNGAGIHGVTHNVAILPVKIMKGNQAPNSPIRPQSTDFPEPDETSLEKYGFSGAFVDRVARGFLYAIRSGAQVINLSMAWPEAAESSVMRRLVELASRKGIIVVTSAANDSTAARVMPCMYTGVICVASHGPDGALSHFSNYGSGVDIAAPGLHILSTYPTRMRPRKFTERPGYDFKDGTSMASPYVAGGVARLLNLGLSREETFARLLVGARPSLPSSLRPESMVEKFTRSGNMDLSRSWNAKPEPLILPADKRLIRLAWDGQSLSLPIEIALKNFWAKAASVRISARVVAPPGATAPKLGESTWQIDNWEPQAVQKLATRLELADTRVVSDLLIELTIEADQFDPHKVVLETEIFLAVTPLLQGADVKALKIKGNALAKGEDPSFHVIQSMDDDLKRDYAFVDEASKQWTLQLLLQGAGNTEGDYQATAPIQVPAQKQLLLVQRRDVNFDGKSEYVFISTVPKREGKQREQLRFDFFNEKLEATPGLAPLIYDNDASVLPQKFQWIKVAESGKPPRMTPAWLGYGTVPVIEKPPFDPWNPTPEDATELRFYYLASDGARTVQAPKDPGGDEEKDYFFIEALTPTAEQSAKGEFPILLGQGTKYVLSYSTAVIRDLKVAGIQPLVLGSYRNLLGAYEDSPILSLEATNWPWAGTLFSGPAYKGSFRSTLIPLVGSGAQVRDKTQSPIAYTDSVMKVDGAFLAPDRAGVFSETHYELQYHDLISDQVAVITLRRFSYFPDLIFRRQYIPVLAEDAQQSGWFGKFRLPAISQPLFAPGGMGNTVGTEILIPSYSADGKLQGIIRPAKFRFEVVDAPDGAQCFSMDDPIDPTKASPSQMVFFCGDRFVRIGLRY